jgi:hypothetical protein
MNNAERKTAFLERRALAQVIDGLKAAIKALEISNAVFHGGDDVAQVVAFIKAKLDKAQDRYDFLEKEHNASR